MLSGKVSVGHPIDVATGTVYSTYKDISIPGKMELTWERRYTTALLDMPQSPLGPGWTNRYFSTLTYDEEKKEYQFFAPEGYIEVFADPDGKIEQGETVRNLGTSQEIFKHEDRYIITRWDVDTGEVERCIFKEGIKGKAWQLASIEDITGQGLDMLYDEKGRLSGIQQRLEKRTLVIEYTDSNQVKSVSFLMPDNQRQVLARYEYHNHGRLGAAYDALGYADRYEYDEDSRITREILKCGGIFYFKYDEIGRCVKTSGIDRYDEKSFKYLDYVGCTEVTNSLGEVTRFLYISTGQVITEIDPLGAVRQTEYDEHGRIIAEMAPNSGKKKYKYDDTGNRCEWIDPLGNGFILSYNNDHLPIQLIDPNGNVWKREYDEFNHLIATEDPLNAQWNFTYDNWGNLNEMLNPNGNSLKQVFSQTGSLMELIDWGGNVNHYQYDLFGRVAEKMGSLGDKTQVQYNLLGQPQKITLPNESYIMYEYDSGGNLIRRTDSEGNATSYRYGYCKRLVGRKDPLGNVVTYMWGTEPNHLEKIVNQKGESYSFFYNEAGRLIREEGFDGRKLEFIYDQGGSCIASINGLNEKISYSLDLLGRIIEQILPDGTVQKFEYDALGNLISAQNPDCVVMYERDPLGRTLKEFQGNNTVEKQYDASGNILHIKTSLDHEVSYAFDARGLLKNLTTKGAQTLEFIRNSGGKEITRLLPGEVSFNQEYDIQGQLVKQNVFSNAVKKNENLPTPEENTIIKREYQYDKMGALTSIKDGQWGKLSYIYDPAERLIQTTYNESSIENLKYDVTDNLITISKERAEERLEYGQGDRLLQKGNKKYFHDENGRIIKKTETDQNGTVKEWHFTWDALDQLKSVKTPEGKVWEYKYDALGRRISKQNGDENISFVWDQNVIIHQIKNEYLESTWVFDPPGLKPLCKIEGDSVYSVIHDHLGTPRELIDSEGSVVWSAKLGLWGETEIVHSKGVDCSIQFPGQWFDEESGLHYNRSRYYDPQMGRYISADPIRLMAGLNAYSYTRNPIYGFDRFGLVGDGCTHDENEFPDDPNELTRRLGVDPVVSTTPDGTVRMRWEPNQYTQIRYESHPHGLKPGDPGYNPRHHGPHYHVTVRNDPNVSFGNSNNATKVEPAGYTPGSGTGFVPGESFPGA